jgi:hypothetical protein
MQRWAIASESSFVIPWATPGGLIAIQIIDDTARFRASYVLIIDR